jgi:hypothetical protein
MGPRWPLANLRNCVIMRIGKHVRPAGMRTKAKTRQGFGACKTDVGKT